MKVLLTGSNGFLGKYLINYFSKFNLTTLGFSNKNDIQVDIRRPISITNNFDLVIHAAGLAHKSPKNIKEENEFYNVNFYGTLNLLKSLEYHLPKQFVYISSVSVYGLTKGNLIDENVPLLAEDSYGKSKLLAENAIYDWCKKFNVTCTILRLPLLIGVEPPGNLCSMIKGIKNGYYFNIEGGNVQKSMVLASDVAKYILSAARVGGIYNLTDGYHPTFGELSQLIASQLGKKISPNISFQFANIFAIIGNILGPNFPINSSKLLKITSTLTFDDSKARSAFGWCPTNVLVGFKLNNDA